MSKILLSFFLILSTSSSWAASVGAVKEKKVLINLDGDTTMEGEEYYLVDPNTRKKTAIIRILQVKNNKALAEIVKGRGQVGFSLQAKAIAAVSADVSADSGEPLLGQVSSKYLTMLKDSYGVMGGYIMNSMNAEINYKDSFQITNRTSASMSGSGFGVGGFYDYVFASDFVARGYAGIEQFNVEGSAGANACAGTTSCDAKINYLSGHALLKWYPLKDQYRVWVGGGVGYLVALSKASSALNESQISTNQVYTFAGGVDIQMDRRNYIPISLEYNMFPASSTVSASMIVIKAGWAWNL